MKPEEYARMFRLEDRYWWFRGRRALVARLLSRYRVWCAGDRILDVGCGTGATLALAAGIAEAVGLDVSREALGLCRSRGDFPLVCAQAGEIPLRQETCDAALALDLLEHVQDDRRVLREIWRVCRPGGIAVVTVPAFRFLWSEHDEALHHCRRYRAREIAGRMEEAGFEVLKRSYVMSLLFLPVVLYRMVERIPSPREEPQTTLKRVPGAVNGLLFQILRLEAWWVQRGTFPFGVSLVCVGRKAGEGS